jgi:hypothetical protein
MSHRTVVATADDFAHWLNNSDPDDTCTYHIRRVRIVSPPLHQVDLGLPPRVIAVAEAA